MRNFAPQEPIIVHATVIIFYSSTGPKAEGHQLTTDRRRS